MIRWLMYHFLWRDAHNWRELITPKFWEYRRATRVLRHAKHYIWPDREAASFLTEAHWQVEDEYYGRTYTTGKGPNGEINEGTLSCRPSVHPTYFEIWARRCSC